jgi:hypothetical protein
MYACMHAGICVCLYRECPSDVCVSHLCMYMGIYARMHACRNMCVCVCVCIGNVHPMFVPSICVCIWAYMHACMRVGICVCIYMECPANVSVSHLCMYTGIYVRMHACRNMCVCVCVYRECPSDVCA